MDVEQSASPSIKAGVKFYGVSSNAAVVYFAFHLVDLSTKPKELKLRYSVSVGGRAVRNSPV